MRAGTVAFVLFLIAAKVVSAQDQPINVPLKSNSSNMVCLLPRGYSPEKKWPVIVLLHGSGDRAENFIGVWETDLARQRFILVAVNAQDAGSWNYMTDQKAIWEGIDYVKSKYSVDPKNVWLGGFSAGGFMTSGTALSHHEPFRGMVVCGAGAGMAVPGDLSPAAHLASYILVGDQDPNLRVARALNDALKKVPFPQLQYTEVKGQGHTITVANTQAIMKWVVDIVDKTPAAADGGGPGTGALKLTISVTVKDNVARSQLDDLAKKVQEASDVLYKLTGGQIYIERARIADKAASGDVRIEAIEGAETEYVAKKYVRATVKATAAQIVHELCHLKLGLDEGDGFMNCKLDARTDSFSAKEWAALVKKNPRLKPAAQANGTPPTVKIDVQDSN